MRRFLQWLFHGVTPRDDQPLVDDSGLTFDDDMDWFFPPRELRDAEPWDRYWMAQLEHGLGPPLHDMFCNDDALIDAMEGRRLKTVLCVGSGISQEPHALAAAGFDVTALDISPFATRFAREATLAVDEAGRFFDPHRRRPGGSAQFIAGNLLDPNACRGPFDVVIERRTLQLFPESERVAALAAVTSRLSKDGILFTHCHDGGWRPPDPPQHAIEPLLGPAGFSVIGSRSSMPATGRVAIVFMSTG